ncbi:MAG: leucyl aminopeptidase [Gammaproteobacteria bacterium]|nr:leucyl aminopeptidase [Gammaproteobacteria bacterium]
MRVEVVRGPSGRHDTPLLAGFLFEGRDAPSLAVPDSVLARSVARAAGDLSGRSASSHLFHGDPGDAGPRRLLLLGGGKPADCSPEAIRRLAARAVRTASELGIERITIDGLGTPSIEPERFGQVVAEGAVLAAWRFDELKTRPGEGDPPASTVKTVEIAAASDFDATLAGARAGAVMADAENFARTLQSRPGNVATPSHLADRASDLASELGLDVRVLGPREMRDENMLALLAVAQGSAEDPRLIVLEYHGGTRGDAPLVLVGKGLTFDAGGISLKPAKGMEDMKFDMSGGAAVLGAMRGIARLGLDANVVGIVPSSENLVNGSAVKPGDVIGSREGKTIEVINTDAEGRLILADALSYARTFEPDAIVDCATLTGACVIALGHHASAVLGTDDALVKELRAAGDLSGERCWPLPIWSEYRRQLDSHTADLKNVGGRPAGTITAACFLREFVGDAKWAHLDIAGTAYGEGKLPYQRPGGYGSPTRLLIEWVRTRAA